MTKQARRFSASLCLLLCFALLCAACGEGGTTLHGETVPETTVPPETEFVWPAGYMVCDSVSFSDGKRYEWGETAASYPVLGSELLRGQVRSVTFLDTLADAPEEAWDAAAACDGSVLAWSVPSGELHDLFIAAEGGVYSTDNCSTLFTGYVNAEQITFGGNFHTEHAVDFAHMFLGCAKLEQVDVHTLSTSAAVDLRGLFYGCEGLRELDLTGLDTASATNLSAMFYQCRSIRELDLSGFRTASAQDMSQMFSGCIALSNLDISSFATDQVTSMSGMFYNCRSLTELDLTHFHTASVENMSNLFYGCLELKELEIGGFDTAAVQSMSGMFHGCSNLKRLDISGFDTSAVVDVTAMFLDCSAVSTKKDVEHLDFSSVQEYDSFMSGMLWKDLFSGK